MSSYGEIVKGVNDLKVAVLDASDAPGSNIDMLGVKSFSVSTESSSDTQTGDDSVLATTQEAKSLAVSVSVAAANAAALAAVTGGTVATSGTTPNRIITYKETSQPVSRYVQLTGQGTGRDTGGSAFRMLVYKAGLESGPNFELSDGNWLEPKLDLRGVDKAGFLFIASNYETSVAIT
jgi:hypothetical protein